MERSVALGAKPGPTAEEARATYGVVVAKDLMVPMRDGTRLATDVYRPAVDGEVVPGQFPTILQRTPYDKSSGRFVGHAEYFCKRGYVSIVQDVRGRFNSEGEYYHFINEATDGYDTVEWIAGQRWSDGKVGTFGVSYGSQVQSALATQNPPHLAAMIPMEGPSNIYTYGLRHDGAFQLKFWTVGFWFGFSSKEARANPAIKKALEGARMADWLRRIPLKRGQSPVALIPSYERFVFDFITRGDYDEFWAHPSFNIEAHYDEHADVPTYLVGGWYDSWSRAMCTHFVELSRRKKGPIKLLMGPWIHGDETVSLTYAGEVDFGPQASLDGNLAESHSAWRGRWFDRWLKGIENGAENEPPIKLFVMGGGSGQKNAEGRLDHGGRWRDEYEWPLARTRFTNYYLHAGGVLSPTPPAGAAPPSRYRFDPNDPVPTISGNLSGLAEIVPMPAGVGGEPPPMTRLRNLAIQGAAHQAERPDLLACKPPYLPLAARPDVLVFETAPLAEDVEVTGPITVQLRASSSAPDTDFTAKLLDIYPSSADYPDGYHMNICEGIIRARYRDFSGKASLLDPGKVYEFTIILEPTSNLFTAGHRIRLDISSSNFPRFDVNPNTGEPVGQHTHAVAADNTLYHDAEHPSHVVLPIIPA
ncbi:MAG: CocE/NonD family hydrolase [Chloroflexi bacterium]|nr:CocE/NonD family hydrolase [Chloroflexota bacterium]